MPARFAALPSAPSLLRESCVLGEYSVLREPLLGAG